MTRAMTIREPAERLAALEKVRAEFPAFTVVDNQILSTLMLVPGVPDSTVNAVVDRIIARSLGTSPDGRLMAVTTAASPLIASRRLLGRVEQLVADALAALTFDAYAVSRRDLAKRMNQPEPTDSVIRVGLGAARSRGLEVLGRVHLARTDTARAETVFREAVAASPVYGMAASMLVSLYTARKDDASAEQVLLNDHLRQTGQ
jgi:hypothetical protein